MIKIKGAKKLIITLLLGSLAFTSMLLAACSSKTAENTVLKNTSVSWAVSKDSYVEAEISGSEKKLKIKAQISAPEQVTEVKTFTASVSETYFDKMVQDVIAGYDNVNFEKFNYYVIENERLLVGLQMDEAGYLDYVDTERDVSGTLVGDYFKYNYFVETQIDSGSYNTGITAAEAIQQAVSFSEGYSDFDFVPYRTLIELQKEDSSEPDHFRVFLQLVYNDIPVCIYSRNGMVSSDVSTSTQGVSSARGIFLLEDIKDGSPCKIISVDSILENLADNVDLFMTNISGEIYNIALEYYADLSDAGIYTFRPVWTLYGYSEYYWILSFYADNGELCYSGTM